LSLAPSIIVDCGVDYLTCTFDDTADHSRFENVVRAVRRTEIKDGNFVEGWGFSGYKGEKVSGLEWGYRHDGAIVRLSGFSAQRWYKKFGKLATNCSRIDLQTTVLYDEAWSKTVKRHWREARRWFNERKSRPRPKKIEGVDGPETIYSGQRVSDVFLRCYHRGSKKGHEKAVGHIRYEAELKAHRGKQTLARILSAPNVYHHTRSQVWTAFTDRGYSLAWPDVDHQHFVCDRIASDYERRLKWLRSQIRPTVEMMIELGRADECLEALGFSTFVRSGSKPN
jgi:DNA relaxase NicK